MSNRVPETAAVLLELLELFQSQVCGNRVYTTGSAARVYVLGLRNWLVVVAQNSLHANVLGGEWDSPFYCKANLCVSVVRNTLRNEAKPREKNPPVLF